MATLLKEVCKLSLQIGVEPQLQELTSEILHPSTNTGNEARLDFVKEAFGEQVR